jgi:UDP-2-acetamido-3-amino-2,3-dideoxy-glucuronate N-acetyltransferase
MIEITALVLLAGFAAYILVPWTLKSLMRRQFLRAVASRNAVCLTFDDGPNPESTSAILQLLEKAGAKATFFMLGKNLEKYPEIATKIVELGHEVGEHSYEHTHPWISGPIRSLKDLVRGGRMVARYRSSDELALFRPPYGKLNFITLLYTLTLRRRLVFWNVNPRDYEQDSPETVVQYVKERIAPGTVMLFHDGRPDPSRSCEVTILALNAILKEISNRGLAAITVGQALGGHPLRDNTLRASRFDETPLTLQRIRQQHREGSAGSAINDTEILCKKDLCTEKGVFCMRKIASDVKIGRNVVIYDFVNLYGCEIGDGSRIGTFVEIQKKAKVGRNCKIQSHTFICEGVTIEDDVFVGHNVTFINDLYPKAARQDGRLQTDEDWVCVPTVVEKGASIGSSATILCGVTIGQAAVIGAGSVVTKDVPANVIVAGNPARILRVLNSDGRLCHESTICRSENAV